MFCRQYTSVLIRLHLPVWPLLSVELPTLYTYSANKCIHLYCVENSKVPVFEQNFELLARSAHCNSVKVFAILVFTFLLQRDSGALWAAWLNRKLPLCNAVLKWVLYAIYFLNPWICLLWLCGKIHYSFVITAFHLLVNRVRPQYATRGKNGAIWNKVATKNCQCHWLINSNSLKKSIVVLF